MNISLFAVAGPIMIGPSSSHTAGAARLARVAASIAALPFCHVSFGLHGSFARTYKGHGTDKALVAGALGFREDDERLVKAFEIAMERSIGYDFYQTELDGMHENSVVITFTHTDGSKSEVIGSSVGGGQIVIRRINGFAVECSVLMPTLVAFLEDRPGVLGEITNTLAAESINIGSMKVSRQVRGQTTCCVIETDEHISDELVARVRSVSGLIAATSIFV